MQRRIIPWIVPLVFSIISVVLGRDANWDFLNYRYYNSYAFLHHRLLTDILVAGHATFYNPLLELPFYFCTQLMPGVLAGFLLAFSAAVAVVPLFFLCCEVVPEINQTRRFWLALSLSLTGLCGGGVLGQIGIVSWDVPLGSLIFLALYLMVRRNAAALNEPAMAQKYALFCAGFLAGSAAGLKLTAAIYPVGLVTGIFFGSTPGWRDRFLRALFFSAGTVCGLLCFGGYWMLCLYHAFANPTFPYFNGLFHSPFAPPGSNRDATFLPKDWITALAFPFLFSANSHYVAEYDFRDVHIALAYFLIPLAGLSMIFRAARQSDAQLASTRLLLIFFIVSYGVWEALFSIYRYILPLEMLAPLIIYICVMNLPLAQKYKVSAALFLLIVAQFLIRVDFTRRPWDEAYIAVQVPESLAPDAMVLMLGPGPLGYIVPFLPKDIPVIRADSGLATDDTFAATINERVTNHTGPLYALFNPGAISAIQETLATYHLKLGPCHDITSNVSDPASLCQTFR